MTSQDSLAPSNWYETLNAIEQRALVEQGFLHIPAVIEQSALEGMRVAWDRCLEAVDSQELDFERKRGNNEGPSHLEEVSEFRHCLDHPYVMSAVAQLLGGDVALMTFCGRDPMHDSGQQSFHVDSARPVPADRQLMANAFWVLDDMDESNGATRLIPGSHRLERTPGKELNDRDATHPGAQSVPASAGDVLVFSAHLWHAGARNYSGKRRRIAMARFGRREVIEATANAYQHY